MFSRNQKIGKIRKQYNKEAVINGLNAVKEGLSVNKASKEFRVPLSTIQDKISGRTSLLGNSGPSTILTEPEEKLLVNWILHAGRLGYPVTKTQLLDSVTYINTFLLYIFMYVFLNTIKIK